MDTKNAGFNSKLIHSGAIHDEKMSAVSPIYQTSTFAFKDANHGAACFSGEDPGYIYTRIANPNTRELEKAVADLENGFDGIATSSGMAAVNVVYLGLLGSGDHIVSHNAVYGPSRGIMETLYPKFKVESTYVDATNVQSVRDAIQENTKVLYVETPANPTIGITDLKAMAEIAKEFNIKLVVDNTFCSPYLQKPLDLGADIVLHSMTKFINGHADIVAGMVITKTEEDYKNLRGVMVNIGCNMDPHQAWLTRRGLKTLGIRIDRAQESAQKVAEYLEAHPKVEWVKYPGLKSHPQYHLGKSQMSGPGSMISFEVKGGVKAGKVVMDSVKLALLAVSLGGVETLIQHPASMTHSKLSDEKQLAGGITKGLIRLAIGIEDVEDIIKDLDQALAAI
ncbi:MULTISPECIES: PLP-dependent aspartate aminotransferase family protein [unclassified Lentimicrobium]|uniref:trans-sulfuration enzyme family protein n=1 Tax=unclassified Lentimicrobium TaxID=2677434 RepID=UPI0015534F4E|nr:MULTISPECIES: PLP-dependent aspartate aminotransferase family protein [unclassified Lentimicrobium]NPD45071.1 PLP-dependent transferase [Lentimicrobium sp. S6]NPD84531.1 PLP-dependent transferase [Lentimicrobium sp. L6]